MEIFVVEEMATLLEFTESEQAITVWKGKSDAGSCLI